MWLFFLHRSLWQNESGMEMIKQPFVSGHVSSVCLSEPLQRGWGNEREPRLQGLSPKQRQITRFSRPSPCTRQTCHNPTRLSRYPNAASGSNKEPPPGVLSPVIFTTTCCSASNHSQHSWKIQGRAFAQRGTCRGVYSPLLELAACNPEELNRKNSLWNHTCLRCSPAGAFRPWTSGVESASYVRWQMIYIL